MLLGNRPISKLGYRSHNAELVIQFKKNTKAVELNHISVPLLRMSCWWQEGSCSPLQPRLHKSDSRRSFFPWGRWLAPGPLLPLPVAGVFQRSLPAHAVQAAPQLLQSPLSTLMKQTHRQTHTSIQPWASPPLRPLPH